MIIIILYFFITIVVIQLFYYVFVFGKFSFAKTQEVQPTNIPISVIVCAKNEEENVLKYIPILAEQDYPDFEIVLIDDASSDSTLEIFEEFEKKYPNIRLVKVENNEAFWGNKKYALTLGIKASKKEHLLFTDANCYPTSKDWITAMSCQFTDQKTIVLGYGAQEKIKHSFLNKIIRFETLFTAIQYFSWAQIKYPYMGISRNMAYKKEEFFSVNGFIDHIQVRSGDDLLFINQASNTYNTTIAYAPKSFTYCKPKTSYKDWFLQKRRHLRTTTYFKLFDKLQLSIFYCSQLFFFILPIILLVFQFQWILVLSLIFLRYLSSWFIVGFGAKRLKENDLTYWFPIIEFILLLIQINVFIVNIFSKPKNWK